MDKELWKDIEGFPDYEISSLGRVLSRKYKEPRILKQGKTVQGYPQVSLMSNGVAQMKLVHRLVAEAFIENPTNKPQVNHKDECKSNNHIRNLEWVSSSENTNYGTRNLRDAKAKAKKVQAYNKSTGEVVYTFESSREAGRNGFNQGNVSSCCIGKIKSYKGLVWRYVN